VALINQLDFTVTKEESCWDCSDPAVLDWYDPLFGIWKSGCTTCVCRWQAVVDGAVCWAGDEDF
jgi:hypothetical protein